MEDGLPMRHDYLSKKFRKLADAMGWPEITFHSLRRTHASLLAHAGVMPKVVQERLGHSDPAITQEIYTTVIGGAAKAAAEAYDTLLAAD
jgi:integrase